MNNICLYPYQEKVADILKPHNSKSYIIRQIIAANMVLSYVSQSEKKTPVDGEV